MLRILFDKVLHVDPSNALWTITGCSESVIETIELCVIFPLDGVVLVFGCGSTAKIERVVFWGSDLQLCVEGNHMHRESHLSPRVSDGVG